MLKVAVCFAGLPRLYENTVPNWKKFIKKYNADVFVHTWTETEKNIKPIQTAFGPIQLMFEKQLDFDTKLYVDRIWPHRSKPSNVLSMWYSINRSIDLCNNYSIEKNINYDIVCRARFDWEFDDIELIPQDGITVPDDPGLSGHNFTYYSKPYVGHNDQFGYGDINSMTEYANTFNNIPNLYKNAGVDFCSELFLTAHLIELNIPVNYQKGINYRIANANSSLYHCT